jgi:Alr-MurF fusion protein
MKYSIQKIATIIHGNFINKHIYHADIQYLLYDSRLFNHHADTLFFALVGSRNNGEKYIEELYHKGIRNFVLSSKIESASYPNANFILVENTTVALQILAKFHRNQYDLPTIGITGSNGKTVVKEWLYQLFSFDYQVVRSPKSYNSQIGVPLSVWQINETHEIAIFEAGISKAGEMSAIEPIIGCDVGIFTNIGDAHSNGFSSVEEKIKEKSQLFKNATTIIYCKDHEGIDKHLKTLKDKTFFTWSIGEEATLSRVKVEKKDAQTLISAQYREKAIDITIPFSDDASIENAIHCWATLLHLRVQRTLKFQKAIQPRFLNLSGVTMRLELKAAVNNSMIINDSYSADWNALSIALNFLEQQSTHLKRTVILSDILQSNLSKTDLYHEIAHLLVQKRISKLIAIGEDIAELVEHPHLKHNNIVIEYAPNTALYLEQFKAASFQNETILIKGARKFQFEKIAYRLEQKIHQTTLEVRLNAFVNNLNVYRNLLKPTTKLMAMVKAEAYGHGASSIAKLLEFHRVDYLAVAYTDEGIELRNNGIQLPILVLNPEPASFEAMVRHRLEPEMYNFKILHQFLHFIDQTNWAANYPIHIKVDTGMHRLGFEIGEVQALGELLLAHPQLTIQSVFSHLSGSDAAKFDDFSKKQMQSFEQFYEKLTDILNIQPIRHILNSSGISRLADFQMDMVRLGIGIYGIDGSNEIQNQLQAVSALKATISQIKNIDSNETVGYSRSGKVDNPMRIATISIGYADGLMRHAGNGKINVRVCGKPAPTIGNVCMDMTMIDITHIPEAQEGDAVVIFDEQKNIHELAQQLGTIPYELFTNISNRVKRVYIYD